MRNNVLVDEGLLLILTRYKPSFKILLMIALIYKIIVTILIIMQYSTFAVIRMKVNELQFLYQSYWVIYFAWIFQLSFDIINI